MPCGQVVASLASPTAAAAPLQCLLFGVPNDTPESVQTTVNVGLGGTAQPGSICVEECRDIGGDFGADGWCNVDDSGRNWGTCAPTRTVASAGAVALQAAAELSWPLQRVGLTYGWSIVGLALPLVLAALLLLPRWCAISKSAWALRGWELDRALAVVVVWQYAAHPFLLTDGLRLLSCTELEGAGEQSGLSVLRAEPALLCELSTRLGERSNGPLGL